MTYKRYPSYKNSNVEWLGEVPNHWEIAPLRHFVNIKKGRLPGEVFSQPQSCSDLPYLSMEYLRSDSESNGFVSVLPGSVCAKNGDVLILWDGSNAGEVLRAKKGVVSSTIALLEPINIDRDFLFFICKAFEKQIKDKSIGMGIPHVSGDELRSCRIVFPKSDEQKEIAVFLDRETTKINDLAKAFEGLIATLKEKRQAVISHAATKGLDSSVPMKDSGIEWLGQVPAHWEIKKIRTFAEILRGKFTHRPRNDPAFYDGEYPFIQTGDVTAVKKYITEFSQTLNGRGISVSKEFPKGTLVMTIAANIGDV